ncbi:uncharacterized protein N7511_007634 [Penicillium nucicola]|uniref:uncharacterized protein n=1 Tax=Penicillium nucicola TaxID=1850975 RepID=UPI00254583E5|nr:uncharacterized protein N7511_007634 [Penicillium nucicola]KAJ5753481.1 hypothetical protein N7511_007634 [Penicillium nucicola]
MTKIFLTGATGYVGGQVLHSLQQSNPKYDISALVRDAEKASKVSAAYPKVCIVLADLDNTKVIEDEARNADIVIHAASNKHMESVKAIAKGLAGRQNAYYIQITGASVLACPEIDNNSYGEPSDQIFDDLDNAEALRDFIRSYRTRRPVENYILDLGTDGPKTAIIFPPIIYGAGEGPVNQRSIQIPSLSRAALQQRVGLYLGKGLSRWGTVHVSDLGQLFADLAQAGAKATEGPFWNENGLYFAENGVESFKDVASVIAKEAHSLGYIDSADSVRSMTLDEANDVIPHGAVVLGTNGQGMASRAKKLLGWHPTGENFEKGVRNTLIAEAAQL